MKVTLTQILRGNKNEKTKFIENITTDKLAEIELEILDPVMTSHDYVLTNNYIIKCNYEYAIIDYKDVILMYKKEKIEWLSTFLYKTLRIRDELILITRDGQKYNFKIGGWPIELAGNYTDFSSFVELRNFEVLEGKTDYNIQKIKENYDIEIY